MGKKVVYYVVGDTKLDAGNGIRVKDLEEMKQKLMASKPTDEWTLVIGMHGSEEMLSTVGGVVDAVNNPKDVKLYVTADIESLFGKDTQFDAWRSKFGPTRVTLNSCSVDKPFESAIIGALAKPKSSQSSQGLGRGCQPLTTVHTLEWDGKPITTRAQLGAVPAEGKESLKQSLSELNKKFGYFGSPPVPETQVWDYFFDEPPKAGWAIITVMSKGNDTGISFYNRASNVKFLTEKCQENLGPGRRHTPVAPSMPD